MYSALSFSIAQGTAELPYLAAQAMLYSTLIYLLVHFEFTAVKFFWWGLLRPVGPMGGGGRWCSGRVGICWLAPTC